MMLAPPLVAVHLFAHRQSGLPSVISQGSLLLQRNFRTAEARQMHQLSMVLASWHLCAGEALMALNAALDLQPTSSDAALIKNALDKLQLPDDSTEEDM